MSYATHDFTESLRLVETPDIASVVAAWGCGNDGFGYAWHEDGGGTEWSGGFLLRLTDGHFAYLTGWCDYTGWGCQDGATLTHFDAMPDIEALADNPPPMAEWDIEPADLNRWLAAQRTHNNPDE